MSGLQVKELAAGHQVSKEHSILVPAHLPCVKGMVGLLGRRYQEEQLLAPQDMVPNGGAAKVNVKVSVAASDTHQTVPVGRGCLEVTKLSSSLHTVTQLTFEPWDTSSGAYR